METYPGESKIEFTIRAMYVSRTAKTSQRQKAKRTGRGNRQQSDFHIPNAGTAASTAKISAPQEVAPLGALIAVQEVDQVKNNERQAVGKARAVLDVLDELKISLLSGHVSVERLQHLQQLADNLPEAHDNGNLQDLLEAIRLRAKVELAKLRY